MGPGSRPLHLCLWLRKVCERRARRPGQPPLFARWRPAGFCAREPIFRLRGRPGMLHHPLGAEQRVSGRRGATCTRLLTFWYSPREIGRAWGIWNSSHQIGGAIIAVWASYLVTHFGWRSAFWAPAVVGVIGAFWLMNRLTDSPESMGLPPIEVYKDLVKPAAGAPAVPFREIFQRHILSNRWVWIVSVANFFVYVVRIGILSWAPEVPGGSQGPESHAGRLCPVRLRSGRDLRGVWLGLAVGHGLPGTAWTGIRRFHALPGSLQS